MDFELRIKNRILLKLLFLGITLLFLVNQQAKAQDLLSRLLEGGRQDVETYFGEYNKPVFLSIGNGLANGWYNTGKSHKIGGIDITVTGSLVAVPNKHRSFIFNNSDYTTFRLEDGKSSAELPTLFGGSTDEEIFIDLDNDIDGVNTSISKIAPSGVDFKSEIGFDQMPIPMVTMGIGLPKNTDLKVRYSPTVRQDGFEGSIRGFGILHDLKQWLPGMEDFGYEISGFIGYTKVKTSFDLTDEPDLNGGTNDQFAFFNVNAFTFQGIISKSLIDAKLFEFTVFGSFGVNKVSSSLSLLGTYQVDDPFEDIEDPIDLSWNGGGPRFGAGFRMKMLAFLTVHADYAMQQYSTLTAGVGINIR